MKKFKACLLVLFSVFILNNCFAKSVREVLKEEKAKKPYVADEILIDKVWSGHYLYFFLMTEGQRQYVAYYNADRHMVVAMRNIKDGKWTKFMPQTDYNQAPPLHTPVCSTVLGWDSHNYVTIVLDRKGYVHLSGNMHGNKLTYFCSTKPYDITTLKQVTEMTGELEDNMTYPRFFKTPGGELIYCYRYGKSGDGVEIFNIYDVNTQKWSRLLDKPLFDGKGLSNAYFLRPILGPDNWWHVTAVWRDTPHCETNHDLCYIKSPNLTDWYTITGEKIDLPVYNDTSGIIVDPVPVKGGIVNGTGRVGFDNEGKVVLAYHKFDEKGNTQAYCARFIDGNWKITQLTKWAYRWDLHGPGSSVYEISLGSVSARNDGYLTLGYNHVKYGSGTWLLDPNLDVVADYKKEMYPKQLTKVESDFPGMENHIGWDISTNYHDLLGGDYLKSLANRNSDSPKYFLSWETLPKNRDRSREGKLPEPSELKLYEIKYK